MKRLICIILGHKWGHWFLCDDRGSVHYTKCARCKKFQDKNNEERLIEYINA